MRNAWPEDGRNEDSILLGVDSLFVKGTLMFVQSVNKEGEISASKKNCFRVGQSLFTLIICCWNERDVAWLQTGKLPSPSGIKRDADQKAC